MQNRTPTSRAEVFDALRRLDVARARVRYHGGNDESFVEDIELEDACGNSVDAEPGDRLEYALEEGVYEVLGDSFGDSIAGVEGDLVYHTDKERVYLHHSYLDWTEEAPEEV